MKRDIIQELKLWKDSMREVSLFRRCLFMLSRVFKEGKWSFLKSKSGHRNHAGQNYQKIYFRKSSKPKSKPAKFLMPRGTNTNPRHENPCLTARQTCYQKNHSKSGWH